MFRKALALVSTLVLMQAPVQADTIRYPNMHSIPEPIRGILDITNSANSSFMQRRQDQVSVGGFNCRSNLMDYEFTACFIGDITVVLDRMASTSGLTTYYIQLEDKRFMVQRGNTADYNGAIVLSGDDIPPVSRRDMGFIFSEYITYQR